MYANIVIKAISGKYIFDNRFFSVLLYFSILSNLSEVSICYLLSIKLRNRKKNLKEEVRHSPNSRALC